MSKLLVDALTKIQKVSEAIHLSSRDLPKAPDGLEDYQAAAPSVGKKQKHPVLYEMADDIIGILQRGPPLELDGKPLEAFFDAPVNSKTEGVNDRLLLLERVLVMMSRMEKKTLLLQKVQDTVIQLLYGDLPHPAATHLGSQYAYRSRAILADAVALTRGDRFLTTDFTPFNLSAWGFQDCARDTNNGAFGNGLSKILFRTLPEHYHYNSVMGLFPFYTPQTMNSIMQGLDTREGLSLYGEYNYDIPTRRPNIISVDTWHAVEARLSINQMYGWPLH